MLKNDNDDSGDKFFNGLVNLISAWDHYQTFSSSQASMWWKQNQAWKNCVPDANRVRSGAQNLWDPPDFFGMHILPCKN